jgi:hypothetical protein
MGSLNGAGTSQCGRTAMGRSAGSAVNPVRIRPPQGPEARR